MSECISTGRTLFRMNDQDYSKGCIELKNWDEAEEWNKKGWGIFWTVNGFNGQRKIENLKRIISWAVDIDDGTKQEQIEKIRKFITPSFVIETKRGYQVYFNAEDGTIENYPKILNGLVEYFNADQKAKDIARVMRVPNYYHWKDLDNPFVVKLVPGYTEHAKKKYKEKNILKALSLRNKKPEKKDDNSKNKIRKELSIIDSDDLFNKIYNLDCELALERLSGHESVSCEKYSFKRLRSGNLNILVNGKSTSCFVDINKRIGSSDKGGPTILQWLKWHSGNYKAALKTMREVFPELF